MRKTVYVCDHCGAEFNSINGYSELEINDFDFVKKVDLCTDCYQELCDMVGKYVHEDAVYR